MRRGNYLAGGSEERRRVKCRVRLCSARAPYADVAEGNIYSARGGGPECRDFPRRFVNKTMIISLDLYLFMYYCWLRANF